MESDYEIIYMIRGQCDLSRSFWVKTCCSVLFGQYIQTVPNLIDIYSQVAQSGPIYGPIGLFDATLYTSRLTKEVTRDQLQEITQKS